MPHRPGVDLTDLDDATLAGRAADGDVDAFARLIRRHTPLLRAHARRTLGASDEVDDAVQDTFITAWNQLDSLQDAARVRAWLMRVLTRKCLDRIRARRQHDALEDVVVAAPAHDAPDRVAEASSRTAAVDAALRSLPEAQRQAWVMKELLEYSYEEIAGELDLPTSTVRGLLSRARTNMIRLMEGWR